MAVGPTTIRTDNKMNAQVDVADAAGKVIGAGYLLLVDTGADITVVDYNLAIMGGTWTAGAVGVARAGVGGEELAVIQFKGGTVTVQTEPQGGGATANRTGGSIWAATIRGDKPLDFGANARGLLGIDNMDLVQADPEKNNPRPATRARMAQRGT